MDEGPLIEEWARALELKLFPRVDPDFPLIAAICGGGSSGKSTLFNALVGSKVSPTGGRAGMNRRILIALHDKAASRKDFLLSLYEPFGAEPEPLLHPSDLEAPGAPLYLASRTIPKNLILLDTPDFDTGSKGVYTNRQWARKALETADFFLYIFTNSNYNNRDNTDFVARMLTGIGTRKAFLVYRAYPSFTDAEVGDHAMTVARNLYGTQAEDQVLGIYRIDEDNAVASGKRFPSLSPIQPESPPFSEALDAVDPRKLRKSMLESVLADAVLQAQSLSADLRLSREKLLRCKDRLIAVQDAQVRRALTCFPADRITKRFVKIWTASDPMHIRSLRKTGQILETPFRLLVKVFGRFRGTAASEISQGRPADFESQLESDLLHAAHELFSAALEGRDLSSMPPASPEEESKVDLHGKPEKPLRAQRAPGHPVIQNQQDVLARTGWPATRDALLAQKEWITGISESMDRELWDIANGFRRRMRPADRIRQSLSAALNVLPATIAVTYILHTGDPVGAVGIKVKLASLLGAKDLYALLAIPATAGLKSADVKQLQEMLEPLAQVWFESQYKKIETLFEAHITGKILGRAGEALTRSQPLGKRVLEDLRTLGSMALESGSGRTPDA